jgi:hypothetical protein
MTGCRVEVDELRGRHAGRGLVSLVGGGPGDPDLLTVRARRRLAEADVVVVDRLAPRSVLADLGPDVLVVDVGKSPDEHPVPQDEINRLLVARPDWAAASCGLRAVTRSFSAAAVRSSHTAGPPAWTSTWCPA